MKQDGLPIAFIHVKSLFVEVPMDFEPLHDVDQGFQTTDKRAEFERLNEILRDATPKGRAVAAVIRRYVATASIEIDDDLVGFSIETSKRTVRPGRSVYEWKIRGDQYRSPKFAFAVGGDVDQGELKLASAPEGTSCASLIGQQCKCGPFVLRGETGRLLPEDLSNFTRARGFHVAAPTIRVSSLQCSQI